MRIVSYRDNGQDRIGVMTGADSFVAVAEVAPHLPHSLRALLGSSDGLVRLRDAVAGKAGTHSLKTAHLLPVIPDPHAIWALALNFKTHIEETGLVTSKEYPHVFAAAVSAAERRQAIRLRGRARRDHRQRRTAHSGREGVRSYCRIFLLQ